ncbi:MAG: HAD-superfamily hydrolase, subfamily variant 3 [Flavipsychrobacter sp.]|jgi:putative hydrolase of the HAD superfamily|nr:HAD-superfamily hydrolase, subfamily variant 3 [Flavipsychrobacter sp.]
MIDGIRHIIFDLGGVLLNLDYNLTENAFVSGGMSNFGELYSQLRQTPVFDDFETGRIGKDEFIDTLKKHCDMGEEDICVAWNAMLLDFPLRRLQLLQQLRLHYDLVLLSNTNEIHEEAFNEILMRTHGIPNIGVFFDKVYLSHRIGQRKPSAGVFQMILDDTGFKPEQTLFIDDSPQHIEGAKVLGIQTIWLEKGMTIEDTIFLRKDIKKGE